jgi:hypothetical protein
VVAFLKGLIDGNPPSADWDRRLSFDKNFHPPNPAQISNVNVDEMYFHHQQNKTFEMKNLLQLLTLFLLTLPALAEANNFFSNTENFENAPALTCSADILIDSTSNPAGGLILTAEATGEAPFAYQWLNGQTTQSVTFFQWGANFCVTVTDASGCEATDCLFSNTTCSVTITGTNTGGLTAVPTGTGPFTYLWSTGQATQSIMPSAPGNYCVTIASANGCTATACYQFTGGGSGPCGVQIVTDSSSTGLLVLSAMPTGQAPFTFAWNTGQATQSINLSPNVANFCVTITDASGCQATDCMTFTNPTNCSVSIQVTPLAPGATGYQLTANPTGAGPFTYQWNVQNWQTQSINVPSSSAAINYCVIVTSASGCTATACVTLPNNNCTVTIAESVDSNTNQVILSAVTPNAGPYTYMWSTGELTPSIVPQPTGSGVYCVTVTNANGCTASDCHTYFANNSSQIQGYVYIPDSLNTPVILEGVAELYQMNPGTALVTLFATTALVNTPNAWVTQYDFGQVPNGTYIVKISLDANSAYFDDYLPTYYGNVVEWNEATLITIPSNQTFYQITLVEDQNLTGPGGINGLVDDGEGFTSHGSGDRSGPLEGISILLFDAQEAPVTHTLTDAEGKYSFGNLPYGTYKIVVEITGMEQGVRWVTISEENPVSTGNDFEVGEDGIVNGITELTSGNSFQVYPNPASNMLNVYVDASTAFEAQLTMSGSTGKTIFMKKQAVAAGAQQIELNVSDLPAGMYFLQIATKRGVMTKKVLKK